MENDLMLDLSLGDEFGAAKSEETDQEQSTEAQEHKRTEMNNKERFLELSLCSAIISEPEIIHVEEFTTKGRNIERSLSIEKLDQIPAVISSSTTMKSKEFQSKTDHPANNSFVTDEKEDGVARKKLRLSGDQATSLEESFKKHRTLDTKQKLVLAEKLNLKPRQVEVWFQNRRARTKLKKTEMDYKYLKRCCHMLTLENRQLQREVEDLRMLRKNTAMHPFYMHYVNSSLCMSCKHKSISPSASVATALSSKPCFTTGARQWLP